MSLFYYSFAGNKRLELKYIENDVNSVIDDIDTIVEPFCGSAAFSLDLYIKKNKNDKKYVLNDINGGLINMFNYIKENGSQPLINDALEHKNKLNPELYKQLVKDYRDDLTDVFKMFRIHRLSHMHIGYYNPNKSLPKFETRDYSQTDNFFKDPNVKCGIVHYQETFNKYQGDPNALMFLDPPYLNSSNSEYYKNYIEESRNSETGYRVDNTQIYIDILDLLEDPETKCKIIFIINGCAINKRLFKNFIIREYDKSYNAPKIIKNRNDKIREKTTHLLISNIKNNKK